MLTEQHRSKLDGIVKQMIANNEPDENIQFVVDDFKAKYDHEPIAQPGQNTGTLGALQNVSDSFLGGIVNAGVGALKGVASTVKGAASLGEKILNKPYEMAGVASRPEKTQAEQLIPEKFTKPEGVAQNIGYGAEKIAEFLVPGSASAKLSNAGKLGTLAGKTGGLTRLAVKAGTEAGLAGGITSIQKGEVDHDAKTAAIVAAMFPIVGSALSATKSPLKSIGQKIQSSVIRPSLKDVKDGFKIENITKYGVGGSLPETVAKSHVKINKLAQELKMELKNANAHVDLNKVYQETIDDAIASADKNFGDNEGILNVLERLKKEITGIVGGEGKADLLQATNIKRGAGTKGAWAFGRMEPDATATETVYTTFYNKLKTAIEKAAPNAKIAQINKQISELIPISNAALRRLPVEQRNNAISLTDSIGLFSSIFDPRSLALIGANRLSKSGKFGQFLVNVAERQPKTSVGQRIFKTTLPGNTIK